MRLLSTLLPFLASSGFFVAARTTSGLGARWGATDLCGDVDAELTVPGIFNKRIPIGWIDKCYCESQIPELLTTDPVAKEAVLVAGVAATKRELTDLLNYSKDHKTCHYADHAEPVCIKGNPCGFKCKDGFTPEPKDWPTDCVCEYPNKVCNGICGPFKACPSGKPWRRDTLRKRQACGEGLTACGIFGGAGDAWECINTTTDLESCGGCATPLDALSPRGVDCTAIPGVVDVACQAGRCAVRLCAPGYELSGDGTFCTASQVLLEQNK